MNRLKAERTEETTSSERLIEMLKVNGNWDVDARGLCQKICDETNVSYTTASKWLHKNSLPRTVKERKNVSSILGLDLIYWEYGVKGGGTDKETSKINNEIVKLKVSTYVAFALKEKGIEVGVDISFDKMYKIITLCFTIAEKLMESELSRAIIDDIVSIIYNNVVQVNKGELIQGISLIPSKTIIETDFLYYPV